MKFSNMSQAQAFLNQYIPKGIKQVFSEDVGLIRQKQLLAFLDNPQDKLKVIHIAGTSGKGSTVQIISSLLLAHGFKVGLTVSPHIVDLRERFQINNTLISEDEFCQYLEELLPAIEKMQETEFKKPTYFEITVALAYYIFHKCHVDYAVVETGLGGLYDGTNVVSSKNKIAVITKIGLDHTQILGEKITDIAFQKAGIIQKGNFVLSIEQEHSVEDIFQKVAQKKHANLVFIHKDTEIKNIRNTSKGLIFDFAFANKEFNNIEVSLQGTYQAENAGLALAVLYHISSRDSFLIYETHLRKALKNINIQGRFETFAINGAEIIIDGAHNPQKIESFLQSLQMKHPTKKFHFLIAFKQSKDYENMVKILVPYAEYITITSFSNNKQGMLTSSVDPKEIASVLDTLQFNNYSIQSDSQKVIQKTIDCKQQLIITGSLYLVSEVYSYLL